MTLPSYNLLSWKAHPEVSTWAISYNTIEDTYTTLAFPLIVLDSATHHSKGRIVRQKPVLNYVEGIDGCRTKWLGLNCALPTHLLYDLGPVACPL